MTETFTRDFFVKAGKRGPAKFTRKQLREWGRLGGQAAARRGTSGRPKGSKNKPKNG